MLEDSEQSDFFCSKGALQLDPKTYYFHNLVDTNFRGDGHDSRLWHYETNGYYNVNSGYRVGSAMNEGATTSGLNETNSWWKFLWSWDSRKGFYKFNTDATINKYGECVGLGIVIRDSPGFVMAASSQRIVVNYSPQVAEALVIKQELLFARDCGLFPVEIESNAAVVVGWIKDGSQACSDICLIITDICAQLPYLCCTAVEYVSRKANQVAHFLVKYALSIDNNCFWLEEYPLYIRHYVMADCRTPL
ncbi:hypothetical protein Dsin_009783 [Dipteronia sinensis]|uniref:RNase H type-1 domain-containing protein n=1 Tax=Dipteronia sinensis TaxID=43782 RepID=A0AAE0EBZ0_9ROSI|nr:hypothetical protein Dsin_009783 [Dipteronia sinensis]